MRHHLLVIWMIAVLSLTASLAMAAASGRGAVDNAWSQIARQARLGKCQQMAELLGNSFGIGTAGGGTVMTQAGHPERHLSTLGFVRRDGISMSFISAFLAPDRSGGCDGGYDYITAYAKSCREMLASEFAGLTQRRMLEQDIMLLEAGPRQHVYLMSLGTVCLAIKKELVFKAP